jgi:prolyl-tRNA editing enzyme YbaK/EbsC (Cys-tRNA(Pro) deacylase)
MKNLGKYEFDFLDAEHLRTVLSERVASSLPPHGVRGFLVTDDASDTAASAAKYGIDLGDCANTIVVRYRKDAAVHYAAAVILGSNRIDVNGSLKAALGAQRISFADREHVIATTGMEYGGVTAFGLPDNWSVVIDTSVMERAEIVMGAGVRAAKFVLEPVVLLGLPHVRVVSISI